MAHYTYKFRLMPTDEQKQKLNKHFGCQRFIYNYFLNKRNERLQNGETSSLCKDSKDLTLLKKELKWLREPSRQSLQHTLINLDIAFKNFFTNKSKFPKFKNKRKKQSFQSFVDIKIHNKKLYINKFREGIKIIQHREIHGEISSCTVNKKPCGHYYVCILVERNINKLESNGKSIGIDLGVKELATCSDGTIFKNIKPYRTLERRVKLLQRNLSRKVKGSKNRNKARLKLARIHERIGNIRSNHIHQITRKIIDENQIIILENLNIDGMKKNRKLSKSISDVSLYEFRRQIIYKGEWAGRTVKLVDRFYPSSKTCFHCGFVNKNLTLKEREWKCPGCGRILDRDFNASQNIEREGQKTVGNTGLACGENVRLSA